MSDDYEKGFEAGYQARQDEMEDRFRQPMTEQLRQSWQDGYIARQSEIEKSLQGYLERKESEREESQALPVWVQIVAASLAVGFASVWLFWSYGQLFQQLVSP